MHFIQWVDITAKSYDEGLKKKIKKNVVHFILNLRNFFFLIH